MEEQTKIYKVLIKALSEIKAVKKDAKNPFLKNKYASLDSIIETTKPILAKHGLAVMQKVSDCGVETVIIHESGEMVSSGCLRIAPEQSKGLSMAQSMGVSITYTKRYQLGALLNISTDEDTDGQYGDNDTLQAPPKPQKKETKEETDNRPWMTEKQLNQVLDRIAQGDDCSQQAFDEFRMKKSYRTEIETAVKEKPNLEPPEELF